MKMQQILGIGLFFLGLYFANWAIKDRKESDIYSTVRTLCGGIGMIVFGILLILDRIDW